MTALTQLDATGSHPYGDHAHTYLRAGWAPLPLPARAKKHPPEGWTGGRGAWPSGADVHAWTEDHPGGNIALRLPPNVIGVDVDNYDGKIGGLVLTDLENTHGPLPATWRSTSRDDGISGIRFYTIPEGLRWPGELGPGIEVIRHGHRYAVAWPSIHPDTGGTYKWINPAGHVTIGEIPAPETLPALPAAWVERFTGGELATEQARAGLDTAAANAWLTARNSPAACRVTERALNALLDSLTRAGAGSRHEAALTGTNRLLWIAGLGHTGVPAALATARSAFLAAIGTDRAAGEAEAEWGRLIDGGIDLAAAAHPDIPGVDPCLDPFQGLPGATPSGSATAPMASGSGSSTRSTSTTPPTTNAADGSPTSPSDASAAASAPEPPSHPDEAERTSWWPRNHDLALGDAEPEPGPEHLYRDDGHALFYPGRINGILAPSESGKTWIVLLAAVQAAERGQRVTILDFEDSHKGITGRLLALGMTPAQIYDHIAYIGPDEPFHPLLPTGVDLAEHLAQWQPDLVILDGFNAAMTLQGLDLMSNKDATTFAQTVLRPLARSGACVVYIDHTPKDSENKSAGGIGAQAKRAMTTGCALRVEVIKEFGKGQSGKVRLRVDKDRQGDVRGISLPGKSGHWTADVEINSTGDGAVEVVVKAPAGSSDTAPAGREPFRYTGLMDKISAHIQHNPGVGVRDIREAKLGKKTAQVVEALHALVEEGWVRVEEGPRNKRGHHVVQPFNELTSPPCSDRVPTVFREHGADDCVPVFPGTGRSPGHRHTVDGLAGHPGGVTPGGTHSPIVERVIAGERVKFNLDTGEIVDPEKEAREAGTP